MKLYDTLMAPNPRRVRWIMAEKGIEVRYLDVGVLTNPTSSPFAMYNTSVFNQLLGG